MDPTAQLLWGLLFGAIGLGFFIYGKKQKAVIPLLTGIALFIFPYFIADITMLVVIGAILVVMPYFVRM